MPTNSSTSPIPLLPSALAYHQLGACVIPTVAKAKRAAIRWKCYQEHRADESKLREWFTDTDNGNLGIGIVLGTVSGGLLCRDFDKQSAYDAWKASHAKLSKLLPTSKTYRGCQVFARCDGYKQPEQRTFVRRFDDGELRGDCHISIAPPSLHAKSGLPYAWLVPPRGTIPIVDLDDLGLIEQTEDVTHVVCVSSCPPASSPSSSPPPPVCVTSVAEAIQATLPDGPGQRNRQLFEFARYLKSIPAIGDWDADSLLPFVRQWFNAALPFIGTKEFDETAKDFRRGWVRIKCPGGTGVSSVWTALARAKANPLPPEAAQFIIPELRLLVGLCRELQRQRGSRPFYLACRDAAEVLGLEGKERHVRAWRWLEMLCHKGILFKERSGGQLERKANEYRYLPPFN
jgi:hypothetical protein